MILFHLLMLAIGIFIDAVAIYSFRKMWRETSDITLRFQSVLFLVVACIGSGWIVGDALRGLLTTPPL